MPTTFICPNCGQRLEVEGDSASVLGIKIDCPACSFGFNVEEKFLHIEPIAQVLIENPTQKNDAGTSKWRSIVQECRNLVPIIEGSTRLGAGLLVSADGLIITNAHVVDGIKTLLVSLHDGTRAKAALVHRHQKADLAIVRAAIQTQAFFELSKRISVGYEAGDEVLAIGHPRGLSFTATRGIISESRRSMPDGLFVQTDVAINPGNSGGPLLDDLGKLVGINTQVRVDSQGLGFAIPGGQVQNYWQEFHKLHKAGKVIIPSDEELARQQQSLSPDEVLESAAQLAGLNIEKDRERDGMWRVDTNTGNFYSAFINEFDFSLLRSVSDLDETQKYDSQLLFQLLRWQDEMSMVRFQITEDDQLFFEFRRSVEDLDVSEACKALLAMSEAVDAYAAKLEEYLEA
jgi:serine protease Do